MEPSVGVGRKDEVEGGDNGEEVIVAEMGVPRHETGAS